MLTTRQVADVLAVHPSTVREYVKKGLLKGVHLRGVLRFEFEDIVAFVKEHKG